VELFPWEKLDLVEAFKKGFGLNGKVAATKPSVPAKPAAKAASKPAAKTAILKGELYCFEEISMPKK
jgi:hypothetical protein